MSITTWAPPVPGPQNTFTRRSMSSGTIEPMVTVCPAVAQASDAVLTAEKLDAHNTFEKPDQLKPTAFDGAQVVDGDLKVEMPPRSVVVLSVRVD